MLALISRELEEVARPPESALSCLQQEQEFDTAVMERLHTFSLAELERLFLDFFMELVAVSTPLVAVTSGPAAVTCTQNVTNHGQADFVIRNCPYADSGSLQIWCVIWAP